MRRLQQAGQINRGGKWNSGWTGGGAGLLFHGFGALVLNDEKVLEMASGDDQELPEATELNTLNNG